MKLKLSPGNSFLYLSGTVFMSEWIIYQKLYSCQNESFIRDYIHVRMNHLSGTIFMPEWIIYQELYSCQNESFIRNCIHVRMNHLSGTIFMSEWTCKFRPFFELSLCLLRVVELSRTDKQNGHNPLVQPRFTCPKTDILIIFRRKHMLWVPTTYVFFEKYIYIYRERERERDRDRERVMKSLSQDKYVEFSYQPSGKWDKSCISTAQVSL